MDTKGGSRAGRGKQGRVREMDRCVEETAAVGEGDNDILGAASAVGEAELTGGTIKVGDGGVTTTLVGITGGVRGEDSDRKGRGVEKGEQEFTVAGLDRDISETDRKMRTVICH